MKIRLKFGIILILTFCYYLCAFMYEVPFCSNPDIPKLTKKICQDNLGKRLFAQPVAGKTFWWRDALGNIRSAHFVLDKDWNRILYARIDEESGIDTIKAFGSYGQGNGQFKMPNGIDVDNHRRIFVADRGNKRVVQLEYWRSINSIFFVRNITTVGSHFLFGPYRLNPADVCIDDNGTPEPSDDYLWICSPPDIFKLKISDMSLAGKFTEYDEAHGEKSFVIPCAITKGQTNGVNNNKIYVVDCGQRRITILEDSAGYIKWVKSKTLDNAIIMSIESDYYGNIYVADLNNSKVIKLDPELENLQYFGSQGTGDNQFNQLRYFSIARKSLQGFAVENWADSSGIKTYNLCYTIDSVKLSHGMFDATTDSVKIKVFLDQPARVNIRISHQSVASNIKTIVNRELYQRGENYCYWNGRNEIGRLTLPGSYRIIVDAWGPDELGWYATKQVMIQIKGTRVSGNKSGIWTPAGEPYVLTGDVDLAMQL